MKKEIVIATVLVLIALAAGIAMLQSSPQPARSTSSLQQDQAASLIDQELQQAGGNSTDNITAIVQNELIGSA
jgi:Tfp pilus assembly protein PilW